MFHLFKAFANVCRIFRLATVRREKVVCSHSDIVTVGLQVARYQPVRSTGGVTSTELSVDRRVAHSSRWPIDGAT